MTTSILILVSTSFLLLGYLILPIPKSRLSTLVLVILVSFIFSLRTGGGDTPYYFHLSLLCSKQLPNIIPMSFDLSSRLLCLANSFFPFPQLLTFLFYLFPFLLLLYTAYYLFPDPLQARQFEFFLLLVICFCGAGYMMSTTRQFLSTLLLFLYLYKPSPNKYLFLFLSILSHLSSVFYLLIALTSVFLEDLHY